MNAKAIATRYLICCIAFLALGVVALAAFNVGQDANVHLSDTARVAMSLVGAAVMLVSAAISTLSFGAYMAAEAEAHRNSRA